MGISFHYSGRIAKAELLPELVEEVKEIAVLYHWKYKIYETYLPEDDLGKVVYNSNIYGISITPPGCETVSICFLSNGLMSDIVHLLFFGKNETREESEYLYMLAVKTQFAGVETHQLIIHLFRYLSKKYLSDFKLIDEGGYWETNDAELLKTNFKRTAALIDGFALALQCLPLKEGETIETYFERLMKEVNDKRKL